MLKRGEFEVYVDSKMIRVSNRKQDLTFNPGEGDSAIGCVSHVLKLERFAVYPPKVKNNPFEVIFLQAGDDVDCILRRQGEERGVPFTPSQADDLMQAINMGVCKYRDELRIRGGARAGVSTLNTPEPLIEGR